MGRAGFLLSIVGGLALTTSHAGCGASSQAGGLTGPEATRTIDVKLIDNCPAAAGGMKVRMNMDTPWMSGAVNRCAAGQVCDIGSGTYLVNHGTRGLLFFVGSGSSAATKAEVTYANGQVTFDISLITENGQCTNACTESTCCDQNFNQAVKISTTPVSRCVHCADRNCPDAFHFPLDNTKQVNATAATDLEVEFCPAAACPATGWRDCNAAEQETCHKIVNGAPQGGACVGEMTVCCPLPAFGGTHTCHSENGTPATGTHAPDPATPCGTNRSAYCYVLNR